MTRLVSVIKTRALLRLVCFVFAATVTLQTRAAAPSNDTCAGAELIPANQGFPYWTSIRDISNATTNGDPAAPDCLTQTNFSRSLWYKFTPTVSHEYLISSCADAPTATTVRDTIMGIYTSVNGCVGPLVQVADGCADDSCGPGFLQAAVTISLQAGVSYYIVVWQFGTTAPSPDNSSLQLQIDLAGPPHNDTCENAVSLMLNAPLRGTTVLASNDYEIAATCFSGGGQTPSTASGRDVAYTFIAPETANYSFRVTNFDFRNSDPVLYVIDACPAGPKPALVTTCRAAANRTVFGSTEEIYCIPLTNGQQVLVIVDDDNADLTMSPGSSFIIEASICNRETEPNNTTATAQPIVCGLEGSIDPAGDVDIYSLGIPAAGSRLFAMVDGGAATFTDLNLRVFTANGTAEYDGVNAGTGGNNDDAFGNFSSNVAGTILTNLPTYLRVNRNSGTTEPYRLFAAIQPHMTNATVETEPNNYLAQANRAANNYFSGTLAGPSPSTDIDSYQFDAEAGDVVFISLDADPLRNTTPINALLELLDEVGNVLVSVDDNAASSSATSNSSTNSGTTPYSPGEALVFRVANSASYFARVSISPNAVGGAASGDYLLSITRNCIRGSTGQPPQPTVQSVTTLPNGHYQLNALGMSGVTYRFLSSPDLISWTPIAGSARVANGDGTFQFEDSSAAGAQRFYQAVWP